MSVVDIGSREFWLYALSLPSGHGLGPYDFFAAVKCDRASVVGAIFIHHNRRCFRVLVLRRRVDHCWVKTFDEDGFESEASARVALSRNLRPNDAPEVLPSGIRRRKSLVDLGGRTPSRNFQILTRTPSHRPALLTIGEIYLAMPSPDDNFVADFQTENFDSRLWELFLLAAFREQGVHLTQPYPSPDFLLNRCEYRCWVEAVTANPAGEKLQGFTMPTFAPENYEERLSGGPAQRFAKTLRSKLQRKYEDADHVRGDPFAVAIADYHAPGSMTWSREALPVYLYGVLPVVVEGIGGKQAEGQGIDHLRGETAIPAGLFRDLSMSQLSAVLFSNAATFSKFNRMGLLAGFGTDFLKMTRRGIIFDRTPGALEPIEFELDVMSEEYARLWPGGESWCQELEVFHNPNADNPMAFDLLPGATHWYEIDGEIVCQSPWEHTVLSSITQIDFKNPEEDLE